MENQCLSTKCISLRKIKRTFESGKYRNLVLSLTGATRFVKLQTANVNLFVKQIKYWISLLHKCIYLIKYCISLLCIVFMYRIILRRFLEKKLFKRTYSFKSLWFLRKSALETKSCLTRNATLVSREIASICWEKASDHQSGYLLGDQQVLMVPAIAPTGLLSFRSFVINGVTQQNLANL